MRQVTQRLRDGRVEVLDVPLPSLTPNGVLIQLRASLLSAGTERSKVESGRKSLVAKARSRPDQVAQVVEKARRDGLRDTVEAVRTRLDQPSALGYSAAGIVLEVGSLVTDLMPGDRVACGGGDHAVHAEVVQVPASLCVPIPDGVSYDDAAFATVGAIAMHGVRQADLRLGERAAVIGLGLVGQLTGMLLRAAGCTVVGIDLRSGDIDRALALGAVDAGYVRTDLDAEQLPAGADGCDAVLLTAATRSVDPIQLAARLARDRGRVVVVGDVGMELPRPSYFGKELELRLSRSYGPGRYDREYEERGLDYPIGYVRWTERRNMAAFIALISSGRLAVDPLITSRVDLEQAPTAYDRLLSEKESPLGLVIHYPAGADPREHKPPLQPARPTTADLNTASMIGAGSFAQRVLVPALVAAEFRLSSVASANGLSAAGVVAGHKFERALTPDEALHDPSAGLVVIATRHDSHADLTARALDAGKCVFVEKPPALTLDELDHLRAARASSGRLLQVGFNRRWAPLATLARDHVAAPGRKVEILIRVAAGGLPSDSWLNHPAEGGGRLLGEGCHFVDLACWLVGRLPSSVTATMQPAGGEPLQSAQRFSISLSFPEGSLATVFYGTEGATGLPKEYIEMHGGGRSAVLADFRVLTLRNGRRSRTHRSRAQDKGHRAQFIALKRALHGAPSRHVELDPLDTMMVTLAALRSAERGASVARPETISSASGS